MERDFFVDCSKSSYLLFQGRDAVEQFFVVTLKSDNVIGCCRTKKKNGRNMESRLRKHHIK